MKLRSVAKGAALDQQYNKQDDRLTFAWPIGKTMADLLNKISWFDRDARPALAGHAGRRFGAGEHLQFDE